MGTIAEKLTYTAEAKNSIRAAIVDKGVDCPGSAELGKYCQYIEAIPTEAGTGVISPPVIFNRADVVGLNPLYKPYVIAEQSGTSFVYNGNGTNITLSDAYINVAKRYQDNLCFMVPIGAKTYTKLCFDMEFSGSGTDWEFIYVQMGNSLSSGSLQNGFKYDAGLASQVNIVTPGYYGGANIWGTSPWYQHSRDTVKIDLSNWSVNFDLPIFLNLKFCEVNAKIYSIWFE